MTDSILINLGLRFINALKYMLESSVIYNLFRVFFNWLVKDIKKSRFIGFICKDEKTSFYAKYSAILGNIQDVLSRFSVYCRNFYDQKKEMLHASKFFKMLTFISKDIIFALGVFVCLQMIIPESKWHNIYNILFIVFTVLVYLVKTTIDIRFNMNLNKIDVSILVFMATVLLAVFNSRFSIDSIKYLIFYVSIFLFGFILVNSIRNKYAFIKFVKFIVGMSVSICVFGVIQFILGIPVDPLLIDLNMGLMLSRVYSTLGNPNVYAGVLVLVLPYYMLLFLEFNNTRERILIALIGALALCNIALTYSRAAYVSAIVAIGTFLILKNRKMFPLVLIGMIIAIPYIPSNVLERLLTLGKDTSSKYRFDIWSTSFKIVKDNWFLGIGINIEKFKLLFTQYSKYSPPSHTHLFFLQIWLELGLLGLMSMIWMLLRLIKWALKILILELMMIQCLCIIQYPD